MKRELLNKLFPKKASDYQMTLGSLTKALRKERSKIKSVALLTMYGTPKKTKKVKVK